MTSELIPEHAVYLGSPTIDDVTDICLTIDLWSSRDMQSFVGITGHYTKDYQLQNVMLAYKRSHGFAHSAERIHEAYNLWAEHPCVNNRHRQCCKYDTGLFCARYGDSSCPCVGWRWLLLHILISQMQWIIHHRIATHALLTCCNSLYGMAKKMRDRLSLP